MNEGLDEKTLKNVRHNYEAIDDNFDIFERQLKNINHSELQNDLKVINQIRRLMQKFSFYHEL